MREPALLSSGPNRRRRRDEVEITDLPTVSIREAAFFFNMGRHSFRRRFEEVYEGLIRWVNTTNGRRLLLADVIAAAFPDADPQVRYSMAFEYLKMTDARRRSLYGSGGDKNETLEKKP